MTVVSNTSPLHYLIAVDRADLIGKLFGRVLIPRAVEAELTHPSAPAATRQWMAQLPTWLEVRDLSTAPESERVRGLDRGEAEAIQFAIEINAVFLLIDEARGRQIASSRGITVVGVLGILLQSYRKQFISEPTEILGELQTKGFRVSRRLVAEFENQVSSIRRPPE